MVTRIEDLGNLVRYKFVFSFLSSSVVLFVMLYFFYWINLLQDLGHAFV